MENTTLKDKMSSNLINFIIRWIINQHEYCSRCRNRQLKGDGIGGDNKTKR